MKTTMFLSLAGIAAAAGTAFALNSSVLDGSSSSPLGTSVLNVDSGGAVVNNPITDQTVVGQVQASSVGSSVAIPDVGDVIVSGTGSTFQIVEALPKQGWKAEQVMNDGARPKIHFTNGTARIEVEVIPQADGTARIVATPDDRSISPGAPSTSLPATGSPVVTIAPIPGAKPSIPGSVRGDDDDDHDHHGDHHDDDDDFEDDEDDD